ncbi:hypothetical protein FGSG_09134 [Fusarium graminearum PH-1]|uniref:Chromosome 4, complete genome n=1 Tax=Gibberella zeae (strain ATCC MYA-4620 / CBS 123657 / FGSC 9075 / NRRL 31084 / PH-1) TaxID=229533 RepID=I1RXQ9_GIBZE|nr:hypothetical protein FGSG_09134 [Fusarium graminearum PH-1]ESU15664.1 hypothetical protein FGSG_09134 [Fusarium graminearum PH-1]CAF3645133.1 unnamed protein product [Fusarium graminearum]CEF83534.1 unnamed protein product [Fusarium graminearum]|eukprot:XP_011328652.1 hypothetical protein FGSG_09134 [Fusarium graminearum PH-1]
MKRLPFFFTLLGSASIISGVDNAPEPDTWCMTYLSTYLVPVYNQASSLVMTKLAAESGKQPIAPSLKSTFFGNTSTQRTETGFDTSLPTSFVLRETSVASELSSDSLGSSTLGIEPSLAATESDGSITPPLTDEVVPSSTTDTNAIPTSSGLVEPAGRSVIFQVSVTGNEKRNIHKRQVTGGFVGNDKPKSCTFATTFILSEGKLFEGGAPIYYSGESYKELSGQDVPASGSIIKTFEDSGRLTFRNSGLPNGRAGFLGLLGACIPVDLIVYDVAQCQDGRLIGDDEHTSTISGSFAQETTTLEETDPRVTFDVEDTTTVDVTTSNSEHFVTQPELISTLSLTSDSGASAITSISHSEPLTTEGGQPSSESEFTLFTSTTDGLENTASISSTEADTTIDEGTTAISDTISGDTTTTTTADTDTTAAGTTPADTTTTSSGAPNPDCASTSNPYTAPNGITFTIACSTTFFDVDVLRYIGANNFLSCVQACSETEACVASQFNVPASLCIILSRIYVETSQSSDGNDVAIKDSTIAGSTTANSDTTSMDTTTVEITTAETTTAETTTVDSATGETTTAEEATTAEPIIPDTTTAETTTAEPTTTEITTSAAPTSTTPATGCSALDNPVTVDGSTYNLSCNTGVACFPIDEFDGITFFACLQACSQDAGCDSLLYERDNSSCILCSTSFGASVNSDYDVANKQ